MRAPVITINLKLKTPVRHAVKHQDLGIMSIGRNQTRRSTQIGVPGIQSNRMQMARTILNAIVVFLLLDFCSGAGGKEPQALPKEALPTESGYLPANKRIGSRMYYAYYEAISPSEQDLSNTPILLWMEGGPGCSGMAANFDGLGPWRIGDDGRLRRNPASWNRLFGVLILDNPVGTGYSAVASVQEIPTDEEQIAREVYTALQAFFDFNPTFRSRPFYVTGQSYGGKYVPSVALYLIANEKPLRVDGMAIGNGLTHPVVQVQSHAIIAYSIGLIDARQRAHLEKLQQRAVSLVRQRKWREATRARIVALAWLGNVTGLATIENIVRTTPYQTSPNGMDYITPFLNRPSVKEALKAQLNWTWQSCSNVVRDWMAEDIMKSTKWKVEALLPRIPVLLYQGLLDIRDGVLSNEDWIKTVAWSGLPEFLGSPRKIWRVDKKLAGYVRSHSNLTQVVVAGAGHEVPVDQSLHSQIMIESWVRRTPF